MKLPNDLIKSTDYSKAKDRIIHEFECVNGKIIQHYALGGEHELSTQEIIDCLNGLATIDCDLQTAYAYIKGQQDKITIIEKALELAVETMRYELGREAIKNLYKDAMSNLKDNLNMRVDKEMCEWYIAQAQKELKNETI